MESKKKVVQASVMVLVGASVAALYAGKTEEGVLICFWASIILGLYGISNISK